MTAHATPAQPPPGPGPDGAGSARRPGHPPRGRAEIRETARAEAGAAGTACRRAALYASDADGTPESRWAAWDRLGALPVALLPPGPVLVVTAHPDDAVLGFGGTLAELAAAETPVHLLTVTDGEGARPRPTRTAARRPGEPRRGKPARAYGALGLGRLRVTRLAVPDSAVDRHEDRVRDAVTGLLRETGARVCLAPWSGDLHADHEAAGRAAVTACAAAGVPLWSYPVWLWHWSFPGDPRVPWGCAARLRLDGKAAAAKRRAVRLCATPTGPPGAGPREAADPSPDGPPDELAHHMRGFEVVFR